MSAGRRSPAREAAWAARVAPFAALALALLAACAPRPAAPLPPVLEPGYTDVQRTPGVPSAGALPHLPNDVHWVRNSAEYGALAVQVYRAAEQALRALLAAHDGSAWAVVLDADETLLDNSDYQKWLAETGRSFEPATWNAYVRLRSARATPGGAGFTRAVRALGGRVAVVTNRDDVVCDDTRANLTAIGIEWDVVLCRVAGESDKNPRFAAVERGTTPASLPPLRVLMYVGDNIQDFPRLTQGDTAELRSALDEFGRRYILLPNPMYGSFEGLERR